MYFYLYCTVSCCFLVAVCVKFIGKFIESLDDTTKATPAKIETAFRKFCKNTKGDDNRFVCYDTPCFMAIASIKLPSVVST